MEQGIFEYFYCCAFQNGFLEFTLGGLFIFSLYHFILYFQQKDKIYLLYSGYTFFIILSQLRHIHQGFLVKLLEPVSKLVDFPMVYTEIYYCLYILFVLRFLNLKEQLPIWNKNILRALGILGGYCLALLLYYFFTWDYSILLNGYLVFTVLISILGLVIYIPMFQVNSPLKYYMIIGSMVLIIFSVASLYIHQRLGNQGLSQEPAFSILYVGFLLENMLFSLGLGHKQKLILLDRNQSQQQLITQLEENEKLRIKAQYRLEKSVKSMEQAAEAEKIKSIKTSYDKEVAELKLLALRSQMNPHFIFNSLNSIKSYIIENEQEEAVYYLNKFAKLIRRILASTREKESSLKEELDTMSLYVNIENLRFNQEIKFSVLIDQTVDPEKTMIPSLILQPFLENAIWHGLSSSKSEKKLQIEASATEEGFLKIEIQDNGIGLESGKKTKKQALHQKESVGISISQERLKHFSKKYRGEGSITLQDIRTILLGESGTRVQILIPTVLK